MLEVLRPAASELRAYRDWPDRAALQALLDARGITTAAGLPIRLVPPSAEPYEAQLHNRGELQVRERNWHDFLNVLMWVVYPRAKRELNRRHVLALQMETQGRGPTRDALTLFDESGLIVTTDEPSLLDDLRAFRWKRLFWERREEVRASMRFALFGHALAEKALAPYVGMTAHALIVRGPRESDDLDAAAARYLQDGAAFGSTRELAPVPVLGVPGWWPDNERPTFYDNTNYFRPGRQIQGQRPV